MICSVRWAVVCLFDAALAGVIVLGGCRPPEEGPFCRLRICSTVIRDGDGYQKTPWAEKDYFTCFLQAFEHPASSIRLSAAGDTSSSTQMAAKYPVLLDAFIDDGPVRKLKEALLRGWRRGEVGSRERYRMADVFAQLRVRQYVWAHPQLARQKGLMTFAEQNAFLDKIPGMRERFAGFPPQKGWGSFTAEAFDHFAHRLIAQGDEEFAGVWRDYQHHRELSRAGKLKPINWDLPQNSGRQ